MASASERALTARQIKRLIDTALESARPGALVSVEVGGVRVTVRKDAESAAPRRDADADGALDDWEAGRA